MAITIKDIAQLTNTSRGTVDRVLNGRGKVSKEKRDLILKIAHKYGYQGNQRARALVNSKKEYKIGVITSSVNNDFFSRVKNGINQRQKLIYPPQFQFIYYENDHLNVDGQLENLKKVLKDNIDGLIITPIVDDRIKNELEKLEIPLVTCINDLDLLGDNKYFVGANYFSNGRLAADIANVLIDEGEVLIVSGPNHINSYSTRIEGFKNYIKNSLNKISVIYTKDTEESTYQVLKESLIKGKNPNLIYFNTYGIGGGIKAIDELDLGIKIISIDETDAVVNAIQEGKISVTITQQPEKQGARCVDVVTDYLLIKQHPVNNKITIGNKIKVMSSKFNEQAWKY